MVSSGERWALITGISSGIGYALARQLARERKVSAVIGISRRTEKGELLKREFPQIQWHILSLDLTDPFSVEKVKRFLEEYSPVLFYLFQNAGVGHFGPFIQTPLEKIEKMVDLNVRAVTLLTHVAFPYIPRGGRVVFVGSTAGYFPMPYFQVYSATKGYVALFASALREEWKKEGIVVTLVAPGPVDTEFQDQAGVPPSLRGKWFRLSSEKVAKEVIKAVERGDFLCIPGYPVRIGIRFASLFPQKVKGAVIRWFIERRNKGTFENRNSKDPEKS
jgi:hypothetical protein